jgi:hypothetical protein
MASAAIAADADPDLATIVIHVEEEELSKPDGICEIEGRAVAIATIAQLFCDARYQFLSTRNGRPVDIGRISRTIPPHMRRLLKRRDNGCRFPTCENTKGVEGHHILWWRHEGPTNLDNLISLCRRHHHLIHDDGWTIVGDPNEQVEFRSPDGRAFTSRLPAMEPKVREFARSLFERAGLIEPE